MEKVVERVEGSKQTEVPFRSNDKKQIIVFSPDQDLARVLVLDLEPKFNIIREHELAEFEKRLKDTKPDLIVADLCNGACDVLKQVEILRSVTRSVPVMALRAYKSYSPEINRMIYEIFDIIFYKPIDSELVTRAVEDLLKDKL